jgi:DNA-binding CsgD family transcriptional regulator
MCNDTEQNQRYAALDQVVLSRICAYQQTPNDETFLALTNEAVVVRRSLIKFLYPFWNSADDLKQSVDEALVRAALSFNTAHTSVVLPSLYRKALKKLQPYIKAELRWRRALRARSAPKIPNERYENELLEKLDLSRRIHSTTPKELDVLTRKGSGKNSSESSSELKLSASTIRKRLERARAKLARPVPSMILRARQK